MENIVNKMAAEAINWSSTVHLLINFVSEPKKIIVIIIIVIVVVVVVIVVSLSLSLSLSVSVSL